MSHPDTRQVTSTKQWLLGWEKITRSFLSHGVRNMNRFLTEHHVSEVGCRILPRNASGRPTFVWQYGCWVSVVLKLQQNWLKILDLLVNGWELPKRSSRRGLIQLVRTLPIHDVGCIGRNYLGIKGPVKERVRLQGVWWKRVSVYVVHTYTLSRVNLATCFFRSGFHLSLKQPSLWRQGHHRRATWHGYLIRMGSV